MKAIQIFITTLLLLGMFNIAKAQKVKQDSITFYKDTLVRYNTNTTWTAGDSTFNGDTLVINYTFNRNVTVKTVKIDFTNISCGIPFDYNMVIVNGKKFSMPSELLHEEIVQFIIDTPVLSNKVKISVVGLPRVGLIISLKNIVANYEYTDNTSVNELISDNDIKFIDGKFSTSLNIQNIKLFDITGKLIQEGTLNDKYDLQSNKLYFVLFDNKYTKKYAINN